MAGPRPRLASRGGPVAASRSGDDPTGGEGLDRGGGVDPEEPSYRHAPIGDDDFLTVLDLLEPVTQVGPQLRHCHIHALSVQLKTCDLYAHGDDFGQIRRDAQYLTASTTARRACPTSLPSSPRVGRLVVAGMSRRVGPAAMTLPAVSPAMAAGQGRRGPRPPERCCAKPERLSATLKLCASESRAGSLGRSGLQAQKYRSRREAEQNGPRPSDLNERRRGPSGP